MHFAQNDPKLWSEWPNCLQLFFPSQNLLYSKNCDLPSSPQPQWRFYGAATTTSLSVQNRWLHQPCKSQSDLLINPVTGDGLISQSGMLLPQLSPVLTGLAKPQGTAECGGLAQPGTQCRAPPPWAALTVLSPWLGVGPGFGNRSCFWRSRNSRFWLCLRHVWLSGMTGKALVNTRGWAQNVRMATANKGIK